MFTNFSVCRYATIVEVNNIVIQTIINKLVSEINETDILSCLSLFNLMIERQQKLKKI